ncbi:hypothetical protein FIBSPDRAFT_443526 [Athelia psychrophila]|uniref:Uncharacterized protein n=1 Tax=Athelia psychrophila TaxID=1759441 RepID=A0A167UFP5_9AGAM|nr:hypothetical protein FIBSPDRAFT_443526 [Fibularhizoctonia sp. CBS 109695]
MLPLSLRPRLLLRARVLHVLQPRVPLVRLHIDTLAEHAHDHKLRALARLQVLSFTGPSFSTALRKVVSDLREELLMSMGVMPQGEHGQPSSDAWKPKPLAIDAAFHPGRNDDNSAVLDTRSPFSLRYFCGRRRRPSVQKRRLWMKCTGFWPASTAVAEGALVTRNDFRAVCTGTVLLDIEARNPRPRPLTVGSASAPSTTGTQVQMMRMDPNRQLKMPLIWKTNTPTAKPPPPGASAYAHITACRLPSRLRPCMHPNPSQPTRTRQP